MNIRLKIYGPTIFVDIFSLTILLLFFGYHWSISDNQSFYEVVRTVTSQNYRWVTWGVFAAISGVIFGFLMGIVCLLSVLDEEFFKTIYEHIFKEWIFLACFAMSLAPLIILFTFSLGIIFNTDLYVSFMDGFKYATMLIAWPLFLITTPVLITLLTFDITQAIKRRLMHYYSLYSINRGV